MILINKKKRIIKKISSLLFKSFSKNNNYIKRTKFDNNIESYFSNRSINEFQKEMFFSLGINSVNDIQNLFNESEYLSNNNEKLIKLFKELYLDSEYDDDNSSDEVSSYVYEM